VHSQLSVQRQLRHVLLSSVQQGGLATRPSNGGILRCTLFNARSLLNKLPDLHSVLYSGNYDCVFVTESWLNTDITDGFLDPDQQYTALRADRVIYGGGGVCVFVANKLNRSEISLRDSDHFNDEEIDILIIDIACKPNKYRFMLVYRRPIGGAAGSDAAKKLCGIMTRHINRTGPTLVLGDLNCPDIDWSFSGPPGACHEFSIYDFCQSHGFSQCVSEATRKANLLDVVCINEPILLSRVGVQPPFASSDHNSVTFDLLFQEDDDNTTAASDGRGTRQYLWTQCDYQAMSDYLSSIDWSQMFYTNFTADDIWAAFCQQLDQAIDMFVPKVEVRERRSVRIWRYPRHIRRLMSRKLAVWHAYKSNRSDITLRAKYAETSANCCEAITRYEVYKETKIISSGNIGAFYKYANKKLTSRSTVGTLSTPSGETAVNDIDKAELLNNYFSSVCTQDDGKAPMLAPRLSGDGLGSVVFDAAKLYAAVRRTKTKHPSSSGPDGYPVILMRSTISALAQPLTQMFSSFQSVGKLPTSWKSATVTPIYKKGPSSDPANYRPVSQTSIFSKLMERVVVADLTAYMLKNKLITKQQHGFISRRSTTTNLLESLSDWTLAINNRLTQTVIYVDFTKAFDTVSHPKLIAKLKAYGIHSELLLLVTDFLTGRVQRTRVGHSLSTSAFLDSGVVQGSCLGPLLFLIFINDLAEIFDPDIIPKLYADDLKLYTTIESNTDNILLQQNVDRLADWANTWQLGISIRKCQTLHLNTRQQSGTPAIFHIGSATLENAANIRDLGVQVDPDLKFSVHIGQVVRKALTRSNLILRCFISRDIPTLVKAFIVYVRPLLEYCSPVWSPHLIKDIASLESVQRKFTKRLSGMRRVKYADRLKVVGLERLDIRRIRLDLVMCYKILFGMTCLDPAQFFTITPCQSTRGHAFKLFVQGATIDARKFFFSNRIVRAWNELPNNAANFESLAKFKISLNKIDLSVHCIELK